jgi:uncharacterized protein YbjT (DUF2867 family)
MKLKIIITGASGMVGEGVLLECLKQPMVGEVLAVGRKSSGLQHPKLKELIIPDFLKAEDFEKSLTGYDACFYCAGISSLGLDEKAYTFITYDTTLHFAKVMKRVNPLMVFTFVSGSHTDSSEHGKSMWARVKGRTENALMHVFPGRQYNFRPGLMKPAKEQKNFKGYNKSIRVLYPLLRPFFPSFTISEMAVAMINVVINGYDKAVLEVEDIKKLAKGGVIKD